MALLSDPPLKLETGGSEHAPPEHPEGAVGTERREGTKESEGKKKRYRSVPDGKGGWTTVEIK